MGYTATRQYHDGSQRRRAAQSERAPLHAMELKPGAVLLAGEAARGDEARPIGESDGHGLKAWRRKPPRSGRRTSTGVGTEQDDQWIAATNQHQGRPALGSPTRSLARPHHQAKPISPRRRYFE